MKAAVLHDNDGTILSVTLMDPSIEIEPKAGQFVLKIDPSEIGLGDLRELDSKNCGRVGASFKRIVEGMRVDVHARKLMSSAKSA